MKWLLAALCACGCVSAMADDYRFAAPQKLKPDHRQLDGLEKYLTHLQARFDEARTIQQTRDSRLMFDLEDSGVWLKFERTI